MRISLINVSGYISSDGSHLISALLNRAGHSVKNVFLARQDSLVYKREEIELLHEIINDTDLVMVAVMSPFSIWAVDVTEFVHKNYPGMKVIWGGPHCIAAPELSLRYADGVCFSEGDEVVVDLVNQMEAGEDYTNTPNMAFHIDGLRIVNGVLPPFSDLDSLPYPDFDIDDKFLLDRHLSPFTKETLKKYFPQYPLGLKNFFFTTSRGCPHQCSYCNNSRYIAMYHHYPIRYHSVNYVINELEQTLRNLDFIEMVGIGDDDFLTRPTHELEDFADQYKRKIGLPFAINASANTYSNEAMEILLSTGLKVIQVGVQSGSQRVLDEVFNRKVKVSKTKKIVYQIASYQKKHNLVLILDFIIDNPYETRDDIIQTYQYLIDLPLQVKINWFFLSFFPGTPIYEKALKDGIIEKFSEKTFRFYTTQAHIVYQKNYETILVFLCTFLYRHKLVDMFQNLSSLFLEVAL